jgi:hypothetical protein
MPETAASAPRGERVPAWEGTTEGRPAKVDSGGQTGMEGESVASGLSICPVVSFPARGLMD